jgi:hypothetical protein
MRINLEIGTFAPIIVRMRINPEIQFSRMRRNPNINLFLFQTVNLYNHGRKSAYFLIYAPALNGGFRVMS